MIQKIIPGITAFLYPETYSSNIYLIQGAKKNTLIDSGTSTNAKQLIQDLNSFDVLPQDIQLILHTHGHADHFGADKFFPKAEIFMSREDASYVNANMNEFTFSEMFADNFFPIITRFLKPNELIDLGKFKLKCISTPGHTPGGFCFLEENYKILFSGDSLFNGNIGRTDLFGGNSVRLKNSIENLSEFNFDFLLPGHGELLNGIKENEKNIELAKLLFD